MNSLIAIASITLCFIASGWYLSYLNTSAGKIERFGLAFILGAGFTTFLWFIGYRIGLSLNLVNFGIASLTTVGLGFVLSRVLHLSPLPKQQKPLSKSEKYLSITIIFLLLSAFIIGSYNPLSAWDSIALYDFRGHAIAISHSLSDFEGLSYYLSYPLMTSLVHALVYMLGGVNAQGIHAIIFSSFIAIIYGRLSEWMKPKYVLLTCLLIILQNEIFSHATFAYTNLPYTTYLLAGLLYAVSSGKYSMLLAGFMLGLSTWVRSAEVFWIAGIILLIYEGFKSRRLLQAIIGVGIILVARYGWTSYVSAILLSINEPVESLTTHISISILPVILHNLPQIMHYINEYLIQPYLINWLLVIPTALICITHRHSRLFSLLCGLILSTGLVVVGVMVFSTFFETWDQIGDSAKRMILFIIPYTTIIAMYALDQQTTKDNHGK